MGIVCPSLTYGSLVWSRVTELKTIQDSLRKVNCLALLSLGKFRSRTPTVGLKIIFDVMPLHLFIKAEAAAAYLRLHKDSHSGEPQISMRNREISHVQIQRSLYFKVQTCI